MSTKSQINKENKFSKGKIERLYCQANMVIPEIIEESPPTLKTLLVNLQPHCDCSRCVFVEPMDRADNLPVNTMHVTKIQGETEIAT